jgi:RNA polymerase sigma factor (sigma-70 family)
MSDSEKYKIAQMSDREIVAALLARDRGITEAYFYRKCYPLFKACFDSYYTDCETCIEFINEIYLYLMLPNPATQRSYMQNFSFRCSLTNWLKIVAQTYCHQLFKKKGAFFEDSLDDGDRFTQIADSRPENGTFDRSDLELVLQMMPNVRYRELIRIKYLEGCSNEETAERLGMTMDNFYNKHLLAKKQFITALKKEGLV